MPTQTFINLSKEKKEKIIHFAIKEFASNPFSEVSINKIIKNAKISRGSFYTYFADKYDLLIYLMDELKEKLIQNLQLHFEQNQTNLEDIILEIHKNFFDLCADEIYKKFLTNVLIYFFGKAEDEIMRVKEKNQFPRNNSRILLLLDYTQFKHNSVDYINKTIDIVFAILNQVLFTSAIQKLSYLESKELLKEYLIIANEGYRRV